MKTRTFNILPVAGLLALGISPQLRGEMPQANGRRPVPTPRPNMGDSAFVPSMQPGGIISERRGAPETVPAPRRALPTAPPGRPPVLRPTFRRLAPTTTIGYLPTFARCTVLPTMTYWHDREYDIMAAIQREARRGYIPVTPYPVDKDSITGSTMVASGFRIYGFVVPAGGQVLLKLDFHKPAWVKISWVDQWGEYRPGMMIKPGEPEALYINQGKKTVAVYAIVDDPGQWATETDPFTLTAKRNFDAAHFDTQGVTINQGIWNTAPESYWLSAAHP